MDVQVNVPLLRKVVEWVEEQEARTEGREWWQCNFFVSGLGEGWCDTAYCVAGKVALDAGWERSGSVYVTRGGEERAVVYVAEELLGLQPGHGLFGGQNTASDIRRIAEDIAGERL